jgi:hypothetical protein
MHTIRFISLTFALLFAAPSAAHEATSALMAETAGNLIAALTPEQKAKAVLPFAGDARKDWHFIPKDRKGLPLKELANWQQPLAHAFMAAGLSQRGYIKTTTIMSLEEILRVQEGARGGRRDPGLYYISIFGQPSASAPWGWSIEGHHVSLNFTVVDGKMIATTPAFFGTNPAEIKEGPRKGLRVLGREEDLARTLLGALDAGQRKAAVIAADAPRDIETMNKVRAAPLAAMGLAAAKMTPAQTQVLIALLEEYASTMPPALAEERMKKVRAAGLEKVQFAWAGNGERGQPHYYRVQGPTFLVEYDNTQNGANHVHSVWRDFAGDFGEDLLGEHYRNAPHHQKK